MIVTDLNYHLETRLVHKLDLIVKRCTNPKTRKDALLIIEGSEGEGKTNSSEAIGYYFKYKTKREIHLFFRLDPLINFAKKTSEKIIIWDEPALDSLSIDWYKEINKSLIRLLMTCRKKRHIFIFNIVKFYKFSEYVIVDRALGLIHMYTRKEEQPGRFVYVRKKNLERLYSLYRKSKIRDFKTVRSFGGSFPIIEHLLGNMGITIDGFNNATLEDYERLKDVAINSLETMKDGSIETKKYIELKKNISLIKLPIKTRGELAKQLQINMRTLQRWGKLEPIAKKDEDLNTTAGKHIIFGG